MIQPLVRPVAAAALVLLTAAGCRSEHAAAPRASSTPRAVSTDQARVAVTIAGGGFTITNVSGGYVSYALLDRDYAQETLATWGPCGPCVLAPHASATVARDDVPGLTAGSAALLVIDWRNEPVGEAAQVVDPEQLEVPLTR